MVSLTRFMGINVVFYLCFLFIPFFPHKKNFENYVIHLFIRFLITTIYAAILFLGLTVILFTVDHLLGIQVKEQTYFYTLLMVSLIFAPTFHLHSHSIHLFWKDLIFNGMAPGSCIPFGSLVWLASYCSTIFYSPHKK